MGNLLDQKRSLTAQLAMLQGGRDDESRPPVLLEISLARPYVLTVVIAAEDTVTEIIWVLYAHRPNISY